MAKNYEARKLQKDMPNRQNSWDAPLNSRFTSLSHPPERTARPPRQPRPKSQGMRRTKNK